MIKALLDAEILLRSTQIDQGQNLIKIGLDESASLEDAQSIRNKLNIPPTAVQFALTSKGDFLAGDDLQDKWCPLLGITVRLSTGPGQRRPGLSVSTPPRQKTV